jgi:hypothetical protein
MPCGYCSEPGHIMRHCNSSAAQHLLSNYRRNCVAPRTAQQQQHFLSSFTSDMLSIIMYSYGATSVSGNRASKEQFIRARLPPPVVAQPVVAQPVIALRQPVVFQQPAALQPAVVRETRVEYKARMKIVADTLFTVICVNDYGITTYTAANNTQFSEMITTLCETILEQTRNTLTDAFPIAKLIIKQFHLTRAIAPAVKHVFFNELMRENSRLNEIRLIRLQALGVLPRPQDFVPHKPKFAAIQMLNVVAVEADDYMCGICSDDFTRETIVTLKCAHTICGVCISGQIKARAKSCILCPYCREEVHEISIGNEAIRNQISALVIAEIAK